MSARNLSNGHAQFGLALTSYSSLAMVEAAKRRREQGAVAEFHALAVVREVRSSEKLGTDCSQTKSLVLCDC